MIAWHRTQTVTLRDLFHGFRSGIVSRVHLAFDNLLRGSVLSDRFRAEHNAAVRRFFEQWRGREVDADVTDATSPLYREVLSLVSDQLRSGAEESTLLDIGCGGLSLHKWLQAQQVVFREYVACDLTQARNGQYAREHSIRLVEGDFTSPNTDLGHSYDWLVLINVLTYCPDLHQAMGALPKGHGARVLIIEPHPSLYWEPYFDRVRVRYRHAAVLIEAGAREDWICTSWISVVRPCIGGLLRVPLCNALVLTYHGDYDNTIAAPL